MKTLLILLAAGALGGNLLPLLHRATRSLNLTSSGNTLAGLVGGGLGGSLATALGLTPPDGSARPVLTGLAGLAGGMLVVAVIGAARNRMAK